MDPRFGEAGQYFVSVVLAEASSQVSRRHDDLTVTREGGQLWSRRRDAGASLVPSPRPSVHSSCL